MHLYNSTYFLISSTVAINLSTLLVAGIFFRLNYKSNRRLPMWLLNSTLDGDEGSKQNSWRPFHF